MGSGLSSLYVAASQLLAPAVVTNSKLGTDIAVGSTVFLAFTKLDAIIQGTWVYAVDVGCRFNSKLQNTSHATGDAFENYVYLSAGTYTLRCIGIAGASEGLGTLALDGTTIGTVDFYAVGTAKNTVKEIAGIVVATNGLKTLRTTITKNGASADYYYEPTSYEFIKTA